MSRLSNLARFGLLAGALVAAPLAAQGASFINILTGGTGGVYYPLGVALSKIYAEHIKDSKPSVQSTKASVENLNLLQQGRGEIAFTLGDTLADAWNGNAEVGFKQKLDKLRTVAAIYPNYIQIAALKDANIHTLADLKGKRLSVGAPKSGTELNARAILKGAGMTYKDVVKVTIFLTDSRFVAPYREVRDQFITEPPYPASTLLVVAGLADPAMLVEVEVVAAKV